MLEQTDSLNKVQSVAKAGGGNDIFLMADKAESENSRSNTKYLNEDNFQTRANSKGK